MSEHAITSIEGMLEQLTGLWRAAIVRAAVELHIADHLSAGLDSASDVAEAEDAEPRSVGVLLDALTALGFLEKTGDRYVLEPLVQVLLPAMQSFGSVYLNAPTWAMWGELSQTVRSGEPAHTDEEYWVGFARASRQLAHLQGMTAREYAGLEMGSSARILDLGCGSGGMGYAFTIADPTIVVTSVDTRDVLAVASDYAEELRIGDRVVLRELDITAAPTFGDREFNLVLVSNLLHLLDEDGSRTILRNVHRALAPHGRVLITEIVPDDERRRAQYALMFAVEMLLRTRSGNCYTFEEIARWLVDAGFGQPLQHPMLGHTTAITATRR